MRTVVIYESMYGNTHLIADAIADGLRSVSGDVAIVPVADTVDDVLEGADLVVVGGPTHAHGMSRARHSASCGRCARARPRAHP